MGHPDHLPGDRRAARANYATDPTTKDYVDKLNIFILPSSNPDGGHDSFHDFGCSART